MQYADICGIYKIKYVGTIITQWVKRTLDRFHLFYLGLQKYEFALKSAVLSLRFQFKKFSFWPKCKTNNST